MFLIRRLAVGVAGREHHALNAQVHHLVEEGANAFGLSAVEQRGVRSHTKPALESFAYSIDCNVVSAFAADSQVVLLALTVQMHAKGQIFAWLEEVNLFFQKKSVGAKVDIFLSRDQPLDDLPNLRMHERFAARDRDHRRPTLINSPEAFLRREILFQNVSRILNLAASRAGEITAKKWLEHQHQRILLPSGKLLPEDIAAHSPHL